jgi:hypothetical protein
MTYESARNRQFPSPIILCNIVGSFRSFGIIGLNGAISGKSTKEHMSLCAFSSIGTKAYGQAIQYLLYSIQCISQLTLFYRKHFTQLNTKNNKKPFFKRGM